ncbi:uncharacterized protein ARB_00973 [Trichophyton benhamiae CBS 112371]|uniref:Uncharacterized protein n=1 Tax=Arthroderma benhamiae (strain ATCC MYA-4681 / CBS 112371) TaxID=663331 RepID=D4AXQ4_ARTBC|nr:uncharacterized protein ARB_00973 [Trichophyton benhamiae CBS 112371]EFE32082.1 hypothetical protein ARB_00973 [Trichophyton benhamiae CBS 112371]
MDKKRDVRDLDYGIQTWLVHPTAVRCLSGHPEKTRQKMRDGGEEEKIEDTWYIRDGLDRGETSSGILWLSYRMQTADSMRL